MRFSIDSNIIEQQGLTMKEFIVLLYYLIGEEDILNESICNDLWERNFLIKTEKGYIINNNILSQVEGWLAMSAIPERTKEGLTRLAERMIQEYPTGKKAGTTFYWRGSVAQIAERLGVFFKKYGTHYTDDQIVNATKKYVESFNGDYRFMHLLKYFINKKDPLTKEDNSELLSYLENAGQEEELSDNWLNEMR